MMRCHTAAAFQLSMAAFFVLVAVSSLSAGTPVTTVPKMFARMRALVPADAVTGVMVFDGAGFSLYLEGEQAAVMRCYDAAVQDSRQTDMETALHGHGQIRRYTGFFTGYALAEGLPASEQLRALDGPDALRLFIDLAPQFDLNF